MTNTANKLYSPCAIVPVYNHHVALESICVELSRHDLPVILVDDGSDEACKQELARVSAAYRSVHLVTREQNGGKGAAIKSGFSKAVEMGYSHGLQIDADGQHNLNDISRFKQLAAKYPESLIVGHPKYDSSVPRIRYYARYLTHIWIWINTLSLSIRDSMCGFRVYPIPQSHKLVSEQSIGDHMDFDSDFVVHWFWSGQPIVQQETAVTYPVDGISHFRHFKDNALISLMHAKLFFGMLIRWPRLIANNNKAIDAE